MDANKQSGYEWVCESILNTGLTGNVGQVSGQVGMTGKEHVSGWADEQMNGMAPVRGWKHCDSPPLSLGSSLVTVATLVKRSILTAHMWF